MATTHYSLSGTITGLRTDRYIYANPVFGSNVSSILINEPFTPVTAAAYQAALVSEFSLYPDFTNVVIQVTDNLDDTYTISIELDHDDADITLFPVGINIYAAEDYFSAYGNFFLAFTYPLGGTCPDLVTCDTCNQVTAFSCQPTYQLTTGLDPNTTYYIKITNRLNTAYTQEVLTDINGDITIQADDIDFPAGFWVPVNQPITVTVFSDSDYSTQVDLTANGTIYQCIELNFEYLVSTTSSYMPEFSNLWDGQSVFIDNLNNTFIAG